MLAKADSCGYNSHVSHHCILFEIMMPAVQLCHSDFLSPVRDITPITPSSLFVAGNELVVNILLIFSIWTLSDMLVKWNLGFIFHPKHILRMENTSMYMSGLPQRYQPSCTFAVHKQIDSEMDFMQITEQAASVNNFLSDWWCLLVHSEMDINIHMKLLINSWTNIPLFNRFTMLNVGLFQKKSKVQFGLIWFKRPLQS